MIEKMVAKLDKVDIENKKELEEEERRLQERRFEFASKIKAFWNELIPKHNLLYGDVHYLKDNAIYKQVIGKGK